MLFAAIDIGSNAARLLFANVFKPANKIIVEKATLVRIPTRLGEDVYSSGKISVQKQESLVKTLKAFRLLIDVYKPVGFDICATAAIREAANGKEVLEWIKKDTGFSVRVIDGIEEANIIRQTNTIGFDHPSNLTLYADVGGGSTDISMMNGDEVIGVKSFNIGTLRILNKKVDDKEWEKLERWLAKFEADFGSINIVGSGGNINKINKLYGDPFHLVLTFEQLKHAHKYLKSFTLDERINKLGLRPDRADVIVPAAKIFLFVMKTIRSQSILVPKIGLVDGLVFQLYKNHISRNS
jgi:exopolyphosphatase/guanosine-5'-triphosphate,3'-diphosphate pyrophosphatase